ncbi:MAG: hypothetical protein NWQ31_03720 [Polaribacter sp.]|nr:hypothetical protein [Polaribacter sp.]
MFKNFLLLLLLSSNFIFSQKGFKDWDTNYKYKNVAEIIQSEIDYAKEVEKDKTEGNYYVAMHKFRFLAEFTGRERKIDAEVLNSMKRVFKIKTGSFEVLNNLISRELEFNIGNSKIWMPIQNNLIEAFKEEVKLNKKVLLYSLFTNEHKFEGGIINVFLISEFSSDWTN